MIRYFSMFSGIGGFELGIQQAYESKRANQEQESNVEGLRPDRNQPDSERSIGNEWQQNPYCIGYSEIDKYAIQIYERHFNHKNHGDATLINAAELPDFDLLVGGFPCQAFSIAGKRKGLDDTRGTLFYDIARIAKEKRPQHLLLENVKGLLSHDNGRTFKLIISTFAELGYDLEWQVLNSKNFGVPQNRERVFIIGHLGRCCGRQVFPLGEDDSSFTKQYDKGFQESEIASTLTATYWKGGKGSQIQQLNQPTHSNDRVYGTDGISPTLNTMQGGNRQPFVATKMQRTEEAKRIRRESMANGKDWSPRQGKQLGTREDDLMNTITANWEVNQSLTDGMRIRRLTPTECERLQAYPDGWTERVSDTQRYKTLGNGVTVNVVKEIIKRLYELTSNKN